MNLIGLIQAMEKRPEQKTIPRRIICGAQAGTGPLYPALVFTVGENIRSMTLADQVVYLKSLLGQSFHTPSGTEMTADESTPVRYINHTDDIVPLTEDYITSSLVEEAEGPAHQEPTPRDLHAKVKALLLEKRREAAERAIMAAEMEVEAARKALTQKQQALEDLLDKPLEAFEVKDSNPSYPYAINAGLGFHTGGFISNAHLDGSKIA